MWRVNFFVTKGKIKESEKNDKNGYSWRRKFSVRRISTKCSGKMWFMMILKVT